MATPESKVKSALDRMLKGEKVWYFSPQAGPYGVAGIPDRIAIVCGTFVGIECKADAKCKMTALQERCKEQIVNAGGKFFLVYDKATIELVRQFIVSASGRGQESGSCCVGGQTVHPRCDTDGEACEGYSSAGATHLGDGPSPSEPRVQHPLSNLTLL